MIVLHRRKESGEYRFPFFFLIISISLFSACNNTAQEGSVVARVDAQLLTREMIEAQLDTSHKINDEELRHYVNRWVTSELLFQEARQKGYDGSEEIRQKVNEAHRQLAIAALLEKEVYTLAENSVRSDETAFYFQSHASEYLLREELARLSIAIFNTNESAVRFRASALGGFGWENAVAEFRSNPENGLISFSDSVFHTQSSLYPPELWKVTTILGLREVSFPINTSVGFVILRSLGTYKKGTSAPFAYVEPEIRHRLTMERRQQKYQDYIQTLRAKHTVEFLIPTGAPLKSEGEQ